MVPLPRLRPLTLVPSPPLPSLAAWMGPQENTPHQKMVLTVPVN